MRTLLDTEPDTQLDEIKAQNDEATESVCMGFVMDISPIQNELSACTQVWSTYKADLLTGARDPDELVPTMIQELNDAGLQTIITEAQKQVDEYFK